ncbi:hypothetical protein AY600_00625 [Phormidium willei BDU 130791]|nr:hypothetical protein AY600_00625 [Phormidium willei BDU 130791]
MYKPNLFPLRRVLAASKDPTHPGPHSDRGLTLIEGLVAILVVSAVTTAITPMIFLSVATRIQNRRAEQAVQLAHGQIDEVRVLLERGIEDEEDIAQLPYLVEGDLTAREVGPPGSEFNRLLSTNSDCSQSFELGSVSEDQAFRVDVNGDCEEDFFVQTFRTREVTANRNGVEVPIVFEMGVRVYYRNAEFDSLETEEASLVMTSGEGQQTTRPLATLYTVMSQGDTGISLRSYQCFVDPSQEGCE